MSKSKATIATLDAIKRAHGPKYKQLDADEWGAGMKVLARRLRAPDLIRLNERGAGDLKGKAALEYLALVVQMSLVNEDGTQLIEDDDRYLLDDYPVMVKRLGDELLAFNQLTEPPKNPKRTT